MTSLVANRRALRVAQEPLDVFRRYMSDYAREQAHCLYSPALDRQPRAQLGRRRQAGCERHRSVGPPTRCMRDLGMTTIFGNPGSTELRVLQGLARRLSLRARASRSRRRWRWPMATRRRPANAAFVNLHSAVGVGHALGSIFTAMRNQTPLVHHRRPADRGRCCRWSRSCSPSRPTELPEAVREVERRAGPRRRRAGGDRPRVPHGDAARRRARRSSRSPRTTGMPSGEPVVGREVGGEFVGDPDGARSGGRRAERAARVPRSWSAPASIAMAPAPIRRRAGRADRRGGVGEPAVEPVQLPGGPSRLRRLPHARSEARLPEQLAAHDVVVVLGAPVFTYHVRSEGARSPSGTELFQLTDDPDDGGVRAGRHRGVTTLRRGIADLLGRVDRQSDREPAGAQAADAIPAAGDPMSGAFVLHTRREVMPDDAVLVEEAPSHRNAMHDHFPIRRSDSFYCRRERRPRLGAAGRGGHRPRSARAADRLPARRRVEPLLDPGAVDCG